MWACAPPQVRLYGEAAWIPPACWWPRDGSSKQRGHGRPPEDFPVEEEALFPSGSAALYRRAMLEEIGGFDDHFFLYCEDTDLGLRARWAGWKCLYVPQAVVEHHYSHSGGRASPLKAYYVERNRLFVLAKNFPARMLLAAPFALAGALLLARLVPVARARGSAARFRAEGHAGPQMLWYVVRAHAALLRHGRRLWRERREIRAARAHHAGRFPPSGPLPFHRRQEGGRAMIRGPRPDSLLVIVPAFNEEGAVAGGARRPALGARRAACW